MKLQHFSKRFPKIQSADEALDAAIGFDQIPRHMVDDPVVVATDREALLNMAELLTKQAL